ncbi:MAG: hypothetical protein F4X47_03210 [Gammaproteobacteria bacterium]|nr:hypothetical protein [Gammaproteobacteria bacterium]
MNEHVQTLELNHDKCKVIDHCASALATVLVKQAISESKLRVEGKLPRDPQLFRLVTSVGMVGYLADAPIPDDMICCPLVHGARRKPGRSAGLVSRVGASTKVIAMMNRCLNRFGYVLAPTATQGYGNLVTEMLINAEEHTTRRDWWVAAYVDENDGPEQTGVCRIVIFNFGPSLGETLRAKMPPATREELESLLDQHKARGFPAHFNEDDFWTLAAIQKRVSSKFFGTNRGSGLPAMISAFQRLASDRVPPKMCLISGRTRILFDKKHQMRRNANRRHRIAFNESNMLANPPSRDYVHRLPRVTSFPGTLVSLRFRIDPDHLRELYGRQASDREP